MTDDHVYYLAQAYSTNPIKSWQDAVAWTAQLREMGKTVLSPILHTHHYHLETKDWVCRCISKYIINNCKVGMCETVRCPHVDWKEDYVAWDLAILDAMDKQRLVMLFAPTCFYAKLLCHCDDLGSYDILSCVPTHCSLPWESRGAEQEYVWAKTHGVKCVLLEPFLQYKEVEI